MSKRNQAIAQELVLNLLEGGLPYLDIAEAVGEDEASMVEVREEVDRIIALLTESLMDDVWSDER